MAAQQPSPAAKTQAVTQAKTKRLRAVKEERAAAVFERQGFCSAVVPNKWMLVSAPDGSNVEAYTAGHEAYAGWAIRALNPAMRSTRGDMFGPPDASNLALVQAATHMPATYTSAARQTPNFISRDFVSGNYAGTVLYRVLPAPYGSAPGSYILSTYVAYGRGGRKHKRYFFRRKDDSLKTAQAVLGTLSCTSALGSTSSEPPAKGKAGLSEREELQGFAATTGKQWMHSPSTGKAYLVDAKADFTANGPDGPGYYRKEMKKKYEKLQSGWQQQEHQPNAK